MASMMTILTAYGILSHQFLDGRILDLASSLIYTLEAQRLLSSVFVSLLYVLGRHGFSKRGQRSQVMQLHDSFGVH